MVTEPISRTMKEHFTRAFMKAGATPMGVEHRNARFAALSYDRALRVMLHRPPDDGRVPRLLDLGCGYGGMLEYARANAVALDYVGLDLSDEMIAHARKAHPDVPFHAGDILSWAPEGMAADAPFDYVVCNGVLTERLGHSIQDMERYVMRLVRRAFALARVGIAFNLMPSRVNFMRDNLFYKSPVEMLAWLQAEVSRDVLIDHAYTPFNYYVYVYREITWAAFEAMRDAPAA